MKAVFKNKNVPLGTFLMVVFQIASLQAMEYEAAMLAYIDRSMFRREQLPTPTETPFSWPCCLDCFIWHNEEKTDNPSTQGSEWHTGNSFKNEGMHPADW